MGFQIKLLNEQKHKNKFPCFGDCSLYCTAKSLDRMSWKEKLQFENNNNKNNNKKNEESF